jgi:hypothetical protein
LRKFLIVISLLSAVSALAQTVPPPCGEKGVPDNVPCYDAKSGNVIHTQSPGFVPHQDLQPLPPPAPPIVVPKPQAPPVPVVVPATVFPRITPPPANASQVSQNWSYQGTASCYHDGDSVQCFDAGRLQSYATSQQQFDAQFQAGEVVGSAIGALIRTWIAHRQRIALERKDIQGQISAYYDATFDLTDEVASDQRTLVAVFSHLAQFDPTRTKIYDQGANYAAASASRFATMRPMGEKMLPGILATKKLKYLQGSLGEAGKSYNVALDGAKKDYVYSQLMQGLLGYYEHQRDAPPTSPPITPPAKSRITP